MMHSPLYSMNTLFSQLGLANENADIKKFVEEHAPLPPELELDEAPFWTPSQAALLREALSNDADWAEVVDQLNASLR